MSFTAQDVKALRESSGAGMMDCKKALTENDGDFEAAAPDKAPWFGAGEVLTNIYYEAEQAVPGQPAFTVNLSQVSAHLRNARRQAIDHGVSQPAAGEGGCKPRQDRGQGGRDGHK